MGNCCTSSNEVKEITIYQDLPKPIVPRYLGDLSVSIEAFDPDIHVDSRPRVWEMRFAVEKYLVPGIEGIIASYIPRNVHCAARKCDVLTNNPPACKRCDRSYCDTHLFEDPCNLGAYCDVCSPMGWYSCVKHGIDCSEQTRMLAVEMRALLEEWQEYVRCPCKCESCIRYREQLEKTIMGLPYEKTFVMTSIFYE